MAGSEGSCKYGINTSLLVRTEWADETEGLILLSCLDP